MKKINLILFSSLLFLTSTVFAGGYDEGYAPQVPPPPYSTYHMFLRGGVSLAESSAGTNDYPLVGGYIGLGSLWDVGVQWQIGAELGYDYIGAYKLEFSMVNQSPIGPPVLTNTQNVRDMLYNVDALFVYKLTHHVFINTRVGIAILSRQSYSILNEVNNTQMVIVTTVNKNYATLTGLLIGAGFKFRLARPLFLTLDYDYVNIADLNLFQLGLEYNFCL